MHENAQRQLGLPPEPAVNGSARRNGHGPAEGDAPSQPSIGAEVLNHALAEAGGWMVRRRLRGQGRAPTTRAAMQAWLLRGVFVLFAAVVVAAFVFIAIGLMSVSEASALLMPVAVLAAMSIGIFLGDRGD